MRPTSTVLLFGGAMALSVLSLLTSSSGCKCFMNMCAEAWVDGADPRCTVAQPYYYSCEVELEGPHKAEYTPVTIGGCFTGADEAQAEAPGIAQLQYQTRYPGTVGRTAICTLTPEGTGGAS